MRYLILVLAIFLTGCALTGSLEKIPVVQKNKEVIYRYETKASSNAKYSLKVNEDGSFETKLERKPIIDFSDILPDIEIDR